LSQKLDFKKPSSMKKYFSFRDHPATANMQAARDMLPNSGDECRLVC
jgi:mRNA-degrading endonuclease HigB of HigAB toxin-antitoxin module